MALALERDNAAGTQSGAGGFLSRLKGRLGELWWWTLLFFLIQRVGDLVNFVVGAVIVPANISQEELGSVLPLMSVANFAATPLALALLPVAKFLNVFSARGEYGKVKSLLADSAALTVAFSLAIGVWLYFCGDGILLRLHVSDKRLFLPIAGFAIVACFDPLVQNSLRALKCFKTLFATGAVSPFVRLGAMLAFLPALGALGYLAAQLAPSFATLAIGCAVLAVVMRKAGRRASWLPHWREMAAYAAPLVLITIASRVQGTVETFVIRHRLPEEVTAGYYFANIFGAIPGYLTSAMMVVLFPLFSDRFERGESTGGIFRQSIAFNLAIGAASVLLLAAVAPAVFSLRAQWSAYSEYSRFVWQVGLLMVLKNVQAIFTTHESACRSFRYVRYMVPMLLAESATLYVLPAWKVARPFMPGWLWRFVDSRWELSLQSFLTLILAFNAAFLAAMAIDMLYQRRCGAANGGRAT